jgi:hypothetical protein
MQNDEFNAKCKMTSLMQNANLKMQNDNEKFKNNNKPYYYNKLRFALF